MVFPHFLNILLDNGQYARTDFAMVFLMDSVFCNTLVSYLTKTSAKRSEPTVWRVRFACCFNAVMCAVAFVILFAAMMGPKATAAPKSMALRQRLLHPLTATWQGQQLRIALDRLADLEGLTIWLDRRIDPGQTISLSVQELPLGETLAKLARAVGGEVAYVEGVVYVGPKGTAQEIDALREMMRASLTNAPHTMRSGWFSKAAWSWPRLSEPRKILPGLFSSSKIELHGLEQVPHDLWLAQQLSPLALVDRATLLLYGFDLTLQIATDGKSCRIVPIERPLVATHKYPGPSVRRPVAQQPHPKSRSAPRPNRKVYSLHIREKKVGDVLQQLARQLHLDLQWDEKQLAAAGRTMETRISCEVASVDLDQLLESVLTPAGLQFDREGTVVRIEVAKE